MKSTLFSLLLCLTAAHSQAQDTLKPGPYTNFDRREALFTIKPGFNCEELGGLIKNATGLEVERVTCCPCDSLILVRFRDEVDIRGHQDGKVAANSGGGGAGTDWRNLPLGFTDAGRNPQLSANPIGPLKKLSDVFPSANSAAQCFPRLPMGDEKSKLFVIAVLDTGLEPGLLETRPDLLWQNPKETRGDGKDDDANCFIDDRNGWNFTDQNANPADGHGHGSFVSYLILSQLTNPAINKKYAQVASNVRLMPLKVLDNYNRGSLFNLLCGMEYARRNGANLVNASLGYYGQEEPIFLKYIARLRRAGIPIITAAGNRVDEVDSQEEAAQQYQFNQTLTPRTDIRDLGMRRSGAFYPAAFTNQNSSTANLITATTVSHHLYGKPLWLRVCANQNYSPKFVDIGIVPRKKGCGFAVCGFSQTGSSFATAVLTGKVALVMLTSSASSFSSKWAVFSGLSLRSNGPLTPKISYGKYLFE